MTLHSVIQNVDTMCFFCKKKRCEFSSRVFLHVNVIIPCLLPYRSLSSCAYFLHCPLSLLSVRREGRNTQRRDRNVFQLPFR